MSFKNALEAFVNAIEENQEMVFMPDRKINIHHIADISPSFLNLGVKVQLRNGSSYETTSGMYETWKVNIIKMAQANDIRVIDTNRKNGCIAFVPANECHSLRQFVPENNTGLIIYNDQEDLVLAIGNGDYDAHMERFYALNNVTRVQKTAAQVSEQKTEERKSAPSKVLILGKVIDLAEVKSFRSYRGAWGRGLQVEGKDGKMLLEDYLCDFNVEGKKLEKAMEAYLQNQ